MVGKTNKNFKDEQEQPQDVQQQLNSTEGNGGTSKFTDSIGQLSIKPSAAQQQNNVNTDTDDNYQVGENSNNNCTLGGGSSGGVAKFSKGGKPPP